MTVFTFNDALRIACRVAEVDPDLLINGKKERELCAIRAGLMTGLYRVGFSYSSIARRTKKNHGTVMYAVRQQKADPDPLATAVELSIVAAAPVKAAPPSEPVFTGIPWML